MTEKEEGREFSPKMNEVRRTAAKVIVYFFRLFLLKL